VSSFTTVEPDPSKKAEYDPHYHRWCGLFDARSALSDELTWEPT
jgi:hypothetical protein